MGLLSGLGQPGRKAIQAKPRRQGLARTIQRVPTRRFVPRPAPRGVGRSVAQVGGGKKAARQVNKAVKQGKADAKRAAALNLLRGFQTGGRLGTPPSGTSISSAATGVNTAISSLPHTLQGVTAAKGLVEQGLTQPMREAKVISDKQKSALSVLNPKQASYSASQLSGKEQGAINQRVQSMLSPKAKKAVSAYDTVHRAVIDPKLEKKYEASLPKAKALNPANAPDIGDKLSDIATGKTKPEVAGVSLDLSEPQKIIKGATGLLNQTTRPVHAIAAGTKAAIQGKDIGKAALRGLQLKGKEGQTLFSDVLQAAPEVKVGPFSTHDKVAKLVLGTTADIALDPTTYTTLGAAAPAKIIARRAAEAAATRATKAGFSEAAAAGIRARVEREIASGKPSPAVLKAAGLKRAPSTAKGITLGIGKKRTSGKTTAGILKTSGISGQARKLRSSKVPQELGKGFAPRHVPAGATRAEADVVRRATRRARGREFRSQEDIAAKTHALDKVLGSGETKVKAQVNHAIETNTIDKLPEHLQEPAKRIQADMAHTQRVEFATGVRAKRSFDPEKARFSVNTKGKAYVPFIRRQDVEATAGIGPKGTKAVNFGPAKQRTTPGLLGENPETFIQDTSKMYAARQLKGAAAVNDAKTWREIANSAEPLTAKSLNALDGAHGVYHIPAKGAVPRKLVTDGKVNVDEIRGAIARREITAGKPLNEVVYTTKAGKDLTRVQMAGHAKNGQYVILHQDLVDTALHAKGTTRGAIRRGYEKIQGAYKTVLTQPMPSYHMRNLYGDTWNAQLDARLDQIMRQARHSRGAAKELKREKGQPLALEPPTVVSKPIKLKGGQEVSRLDLLKEAEQEGVLGGGFTQDLEQMLNKAPGKLTRLGRWRENLVRGSTYIQARKEGLSVAKAADRVAELHFDYGGLTETEKSVRLAVPFYTFTARNTPLQARKLLTHPGKYANLEKIREETAKFVGLPANWQSYLKDYERLGVPITVPGISVGGNAGLVYPNLPVTDLNRLTTDPKQQLFLLGQTFTGLKLPFELANNFSLFFRDKIDQGSLVSAPDWVGSLPKSIRESKYLQAQQQIDPQTGKKVWKWNPYTDYILKQTPELSFALGLMSSGKNRRGQGPALQTLSAATGLRIAPLDIQGAKKDKLFTQLADLRKKQTLLGKKVGGKNSDAYDRLSLQISATQKQINQAEKAQGFKQPKYQPPPKPYEKMSPAEKAKIIERYGSPVNYRKATATQRPVGNYSSLQPAQKAKVIGAVHSPIAFDNLSAPEKRILLRRLGAGS